MVATGIAIRKYQQGDQKFFESFNRAWIEEYFEMEQIDTLVLQHPEEYIINKGGTILMAEYGNAVVGTVALRPVNPRVYEFTKMAVDENYRGLKIGLALTNAALEEAKRLDATKVILYSNRKLEAAISLYRKVGFTEVPVDALYKRSDIKMELVLH